MTINHTQPSAVVTVHAHNASGAQRFGLQACFLLPCGTLSVDGCKDGDVPSGRQLMVIGTMVTVISICVSKWVTGSGTR